MNCLACVLMVALLGPLSAMAAPARQTRSITTEDRQLLSGHLAILDHASQDCPSHIDNAIQLSAKFSDVLGNICDLLSYHDMIDSSGISESRYQGLKQMLDQSITDTCDWIDYIATDYPRFANVTRDGEVCSVFLRKVCISDIFEAGWLESKVLTTYSKTFTFIKSQLANGQPVTNLDEEQWKEDNFGDSISSC